MVFTSAPPPSPWVADFQNENYRIYIDPLVAKACDPRHTETAQHIAANVACSESELATKAADTLAMSRDNLAGAREGVVVQVCLGFRSVSASR